jgi:hypothetical protein
MWQFLQILFFGGTVLITPMPVDVTDSWLEIHLKEPVEALNSGATLQVDVTSIVPPTKPDGHDAIDRLAIATERFPNGCVEARLVTKEQREVMLTNVSPSVSSTQTFLLLTNAAGMPTDLKFSNVFVRASCPISATHVYWHNFSE